MKLTLHIVRKDFRRMRGWLICWVAVLLLPIVIGLRLLTYDPLAIESWSLPTTLDIITGFEVIIGYVLTILLLHEDKVVGTEQFWLTRPISRGRMLGAKMLGALAMVGLIPVVVTLPWWLWCGFGFGQIVQAASETAGVFAIVIVTGALMATLTESLSRAMLWTLVLVAVALFVTLFFAITITARGPERQPSLVVARAVVVVVVVTLELAAVMVVQFLVRRRGWWLAPTAVLMVMTIAAASRWPWPWIPAEPSERNVERGAGAVLRYEGAEAHRIESSARGQNPSQWVESSLVLAGIDPGLVIIPIGGWQAWRWDDASIERRSQLYMPNWYQVHTRLMGMRWPAEFGGDSAPAAADQQLRAHAPLPPSLVARMKREPPRLETRIRLQLGRPEIICEVSLQDGGRKSRYGYGVNVKPAAASGAGIQPGRESGIVVRSTQPITIGELLDDHAAEGSPFRMLGRKGAFAGYYVLNREKGEFVPLVSHTDRQIVVAGVRLIWTVHDFPAPSRRAWTPSESWRAGASVAAVWMHDEAVIARELRVPTFILTK